MVVAAMDNDGGRGQGGLTIKAVSEAAADFNEPSERNPVLRNRLAMHLPQESMIALPRVSDWRPLVCWKWNQRRNDGEI
jgi:hypothetical protein